MKRKLIAQSTKGESLLKRLKPLIPFMEDQSNEELAVSIGQLTVLTNKKSSTSYIKMPELSKTYIASIINIASNMHGITIISNNSLYDSISFNMHINKMRFTGIMNHNNLTFNIRLVDVQIFPYTSFGLIKEEAEFLHKCIRDKKNIIVVGPPKAGKTSFANTILSSIDEKDRVLVIGDLEDFTTPATQQYLPANSLEEVTKRIDDALRLAADRILIPEVKTYNAEAIFRNMNNGHNGFMTTIHASKLGVDSLASAFKSNMSMSEQDSNIDHIKNQLKENIDFTVLIKNDDGKGRIVADIDFMNEELLQEVKELKLFKYKTQNGEKEKILKNPKKQVFKRGRPKFYSNKERFDILEKFKKLKNIKRVANKLSIPVSTTRYIIVEEINENQQYKN